MPTATTPPSGPDWRPLYPFASHWIDLDGGRMHYVDEAFETDSVGGLSEADGGFGRRANSASETPPTQDRWEFSPEQSQSLRNQLATLLFVHGNPTWSFHWRRLILALRTRYRCVAPDHLGCGLSDKPPRLLRLVDHVECLHMLVRQLDLRDITLVAQDWGGAIGLGAMLREPERLARIVLFNTGAFPPLHIPWRIRACRAPLVGRLAVQGANLFSRAALRMTVARRTRLDPAVAAGYLAPYDSWSARRAVYGFVQDIPGGPGHPTWQVLARIQRGLPTLADRPVLLVWGMRDWCFRPDCLQRFVAAWPHAEVHRLADVGHWVVEDAPEQSVSIVERFLAATPIPVTPLQNT